MRLRASVQQRLRDLRHEILRAQDALRMMDEQVAYVREVADEAEVRALAAATPLADRERGQAREDVRRAVRQRDEVADRLAGLRAEQDRLLERLTAELDR